MTTKSTNSEGDLEEKGVLTGNASVEKALFLMEFSFQEN